MLRSFLVCLILLSSGILKAGDIGGSITKDTTLTADNSPYIVTSNLIVENGSVMRIEPGVEMRFDGYYGLTVRGELIAIGEPGDSIIFTSNSSDPAPKAWKGISFEFSTYTWTSGNILSYFKIDWAVVGIHAEYTPDLIVDHFNIQNSQKALEFAFSNVEISDGRISNFSTGIDCDGPETRAAISNMTITQGRDSNNMKDYNNTGTGIYATNGIEVEITNSNISNCVHGISAAVDREQNSFPNITISNNSIFNNRVGINLKGQLSYYGSLYYAPEILCDIHSNNIYDNTDYGIYTKGSAKKHSEQISATDNWWGTTDMLEVSADLIFDDTDDPTSPVVDFIPYLDNRVELGGVSTSSDYIKGWIKETTTWAKGTHQLIGNVYTEAQLIIDPGARIEFLGNYKIQSENSLIAKGTAEEKIVFTSGLPNPEPGDWQGISFIQSCDQHENILDHVVIEYSSSAITSEGIRPIFNIPEFSNLQLRFCEKYGIHFKGSSIGAVENANIKNFKNSAIYIEDGCDISLNNINIFQEYTPDFDYLMMGNGICTFGAKVAIVGSTITRCQRGIYGYVYNGSYFPAFTIGNSNIVFNQYGFYVDGDLGSGLIRAIKADINNNNIYGNTDYNIYAFRTESPGIDLVNLKNNFWNTTDSTEIAQTIRDFSDYDRSPVVDFSNFQTEPLPCLNKSDFNIDGMVNGVDLVFLAASFGSYNTDDYYNPICDINHSDRIDGFDLAIFGANFGTVGNWDNYKKAASENNALAFEGPATEFKMGDTFEVKVLLYGYSDYAGIAADILYNQDKLKLLELTNYHQGDDDDSEQRYFLIQDREDKGIIILGETKNNTESSTGEPVWISLRFEVLSSNLAGEMIDAEASYIEPDGVSRVELLISPYVFYNRTGNADLRPVEDVSVYPNPATEKLTIKLNGHQNISGLAMYSITGQQVRQVNTITNTNIIDVSDMEAGFYILTINTINGMSENRIVTIK